MKMRFLPDTPIKSVTDDVLEFGPFVELIEQSLKNTEPPFVYGIVGDWGTGKTSILQMLREKLTIGLDRQRIFIPIWFNAWKYENETNIIYPLLFAIKTQYEQDLKDRATETFKKNFTQIVATSVLAVSDIGLKATTKYLTGQGMGVSDLHEYLETVQSHPDKVEQAFTGWANEVNKLEKAFRDLLNTYAKDMANATQVSPDIIRFVILIDDLDRCLPETTIAILEGIKNYLAVDPENIQDELNACNRSIFILALNAKVVYQGIKAKYKGLDIDGREYLEKILNYSFYIPEPALDRVKIFATQRLNDLLVDNQDRGQLEVYLAEFGQVLEASKFNNPRKIKRILNRYLLFLSRYESHIKTKSFNLASVVRLIVLAEYYPVLFNLLYSNAKPQDVIDNIHHHTRYTSLGETYDLAIPTTYPPLFSLKALFELKSLSLQEELEAVFGLTRMI